MDLPCGIPSHKLLFLHSASLRSVWLKKHGICVSQAWPPRPELSKQKSWGRPFLRRGPWWIFPRKWKVPLCRGEGNQDLLFYGCPFSMTSPVLTFSPFHPLVLKRRLRGGGCRAPPSLWGLVREGSGHQRQGPRNPQTREGAGSSEPLTQSCLAMV